MRRKCEDNQRVSQLTRAGMWNLVNARLTSWRFVINDNRHALPVSPATAVNRLLYLYPSSTNVSATFQYFTNHNNFLALRITIKVWSSLERHLFNESMYASRKIIYLKNLKCLFKMIIKKENCFRKESNQSFSINSIFTLFNCLRHSIK